MSQAQEQQQRQREGFLTGWTQGMTPRGFVGGANQFDRLANNAIWNPTNIGPAVALDSNYNIAGRVGHLAGALTRDFLSDGTRTVYWALNHPLAITGLVAESAAKAAGLAPDFDRLGREYSALNNGKNAGRDELMEFYTDKMGYATSERPGALPATLGHKLIPLMATLAMVQQSGNHSLGNLAQGGRAPGFRAVFSSEEDPRLTDNVAAEAAVRYLLGRRGGLLPWEQFTEERPEISKADYDAYREFERSRGLVGLAKVTGRNLEGEPELHLMGFRTPLSAASGAAGAMVGGIAGARAADRLVNNAAPDSRMAGIKPAQRRMAGALLGSIAGAATGNLGSKVVNEAILQPNIAPERVAAQEAWEEQQRALGLI